MQEAKEKYNQLLKRYRDAEKVFERDDISQKKKEEWLPEFQKILAGLEYYLDKIEVYTKQEIMGGF